MGVDFRALLVAGVHITRDHFFTKKTPGKVCPRHGYQDDDEADYCAKCGTRLRDGFDEIPSPAMRKLMEDYDCSAEEVWESLRWDDNYPLRLFPAEWAERVDEFILGQLVVRTESHRHDFPLANVDLKEVSEAAKKTEKVLKETFSIAVKPTIFLIGDVC